jgi:exosortase A-associated hydrolase 2
MAQSVPFFLDGAKGKLFALYYPPESPVRGHVLHVPAFAEEMNRARRMVALQARAFAAQGYGVLVFDLFGTGDSEGDFGEASLSCWQQDLTVAGQWLMVQGAKSIHVWGLRAGVLLALSVVATIGFPCGKLLCWQAVLDGKLFATQFLRLRAVAGMMGKTATEEKTSGLVARLSKGEAIEVAGYWLSPDLINPLMDLNATTLDLGKLNAIHLLELVPDPDKGLSPIYSQFAKGLEQRATSVVTTTVVGSPFWLTQDTVVVPDLCVATLASLA